MNIKTQSKTEKHPRFTMMHRVILLSLLVLSVLLSSASAGGRSEVESTVRELQKTTIKE
jgi:hypothetical protein